MNNTTTPQLPPHLKAIVDNYEAKLAKFGLIDLAKIDRSKFDDFHPIHGLIG